MPKDDLKGNRPSDYKDDAPDLTIERNEVKAWKYSIARAQVAHAIYQRAVDADKGDKYLDGTKKVKNGKVVYHNYLTPLLEDVNRATLPTVPEPRVEARNQAAELFEDMARELLGVSMGSEYCDVLNTCRNLQWDDHRSGEAIAKTAWEVAYDPDKPAETMDLDRIALEVERAEEEHQDVLTMKVAESDIDYVHIETHTPLLEMYEEGSPEQQGIIEHIAHHEAQEVVIRRERPVLKRVPWYRFARDPDVPWDERGWEAELKSEKISDLVAWGYKNVNSQNLPPEVREGETGEMPYEFRAARIWEIHDRKTGQKFVISADGPDEGLFLKKAKWLYGSMDIYLKLSTRPWREESGYGLATIQLCLGVLDRLAEADFNIDRHVTEHANYQTVWPQMAGADKVKAQRSDPNRRHIDAPAEIVVGMKDIQPPPIPDTLLQQWQRLMDALRHIVGSDVQDTGAPHPHQISATESAERGQSKAERADDRQRIFADFLGNVAKNFLTLYKKFATQSVLVRIMGSKGPEYKTINPTEIPDELDIYLDVQAETDAKRAENQALADKYVQFLLGSGLPVDIIEVNDWYGRRLGLRKPSRFLLQAAPGPGQEQAVPIDAAQPSGGTAPPQGDRGYAPPREQLTGGE